MEKSKLNQEIKRVINYYSLNKNTLFLIILCCIFTLIFGVNVNNLNMLKPDKNMRKMKFKTILTGGNEPMPGMGLFDKYTYNPFFRVVFGLSIYERLSQEYDWQDSPMTGKFLKWISYIFQAFILRPFKAGFIFIIILFAMSGSFIFPFVIYAVLLYYIGVKVKKTMFPKHKNVVTKTTQNIISSSKNT